METQKQTLPQGFHREDEQSAWVLDLVCGMELERETVKLSSTYQNERYYFCGESCKTHFNNNPEQYAGSKE